VILLIDGRNPAPVDMWNLALSYKFYRGLSISGGAGLLPSTV